MTIKSSTILFAITATLLTATASFATIECPELGMVTIDLDAIRPTSDPIPFLVHEQWPYPFACKITHVEIVGSELSLDSSDANVQALRKRFSFLSTRLAPTPKISIRIPSIFEGATEEVGLKANVLRLALGLDTLEVHGVTTDLTHLHKAEQNKLMSAAVCGLLLKDSLREQDSSRKLRLSGAFAACSVTYGIAHLLRSSTSPAIQGGLDSAQCAIPSLVGLGSGSAFGAIVYQCAIPSLVGLGSGSAFGAIVYPIMSSYCFLKNSLFPPSFGMQVCIGGDKLHFRHHTTDAYLRNEFLIRELSSYCQETIGQ